MSSFDSDDDSTMNLTIDFDGSNSPVTFETESVDFSDLNSEGNLSSSPSTITISSSSSITDSSSLNSDFDSPSQWPVVDYAGKPYQLVPNPLVPPSLLPPIPPINLPVLGFSPVHEPERFFMHSPGVGQPFEQPKCSPPDLIAQHTTQLISAAETLKKLGSELEVESRSQGAFGKFDERPTKCDNTSPRGYPGVVERKTMKHKKNQILENANLSLNFDEFNSVSVKHGLALLAEVASTQPKLPVLKKNMITPVQTNIALLALANVCSLEAQAYEVERETSGSSPPSLATALPPGLAAAEMTQTEKVNLQRKLVEEFVNKHPQPSIADYDLIVKYLEEHKENFDGYQQLRRKVRDLRRKIATSFN